MPRWLKLPAVFVSGMVFVPGFIQSVRVTVAWWTGTLTAGAREWFWIALSPVWVWVYFRYYSIFRPGCRACFPPENESADDHPGPRAP